MKAKELLAVTFGTFVLIILGDGVVANVGLAPRLAGTAYNWNTITMGWAWAVVLSAFISGAHNNPAVTLAFAIRGSLPWSKVVPYIFAETVGAFLGALCVYLVYREGLVSASVPNIWCTGPGSVFGNAFWGGATTGSGTSYSLLTAGTAEFFGTIILMWGVLCTSDKRNEGLGHFGPFIVGGTVLAVGLSLGGPSGYAINPARDFGPRLFGYFAGTQKLFDGIYWIVAPVIVPFVAAPIGAWFYDLFFGPELGHRARTAADTKAAANM
jgi:glycerol uptake facilitator protein